MRALAAWRVLKLSVTPESRASEHRACNQLELLQGPADFCKDRVEQAHQLGLKNNRRKKGARSGDRKCGLRAKWEQSSGNRAAQRIKVDAKESPKWKLQRDRGAETAAALQMERTSHREAAPQQDNLQRTGDRRLLEPEEIPVQGAAEVEWLSGDACEVGSHPAR